MGNILYSTQHKNTDIDIDRREEILQKNLANTILRSNRPLEIGQQYTINNGANLWTELWAQTYTVEIKDLSVDRVSFSIINPTDYDLESGTFSIDRAKFQRELVF